MDGPVVFEKKPAFMKLESGVCWWCGCGRSATQPFRDGAHKTLE